MSDHIATPVRLVRRAFGASVSVANAVQSIVDAGRDRAERARLAPGVHDDGPGNWLDPIDTEECWRLLASSRLGRIGFTAHSGRPVILPVNYAVDGRTLVVRSGRGPKLEAARRGDLVAFEVDDIDVERHVGWSVAVTGRARCPDKPAELARLRQVDLTAWAAGPRDQLILIDPIHVGGRRMVEPGAS